MSGRPAARVRRIIATTLACALVIITVYAVLNRQSIQDRFAAATFEAPTRVIDLKRSLHLTEAGSRIFLASHPTVDGSQHFNTQCSQVKDGATGHVLGCYVDERIHLFDVVDPRVSGIVEVTAAHELLHATYARMRPGDRSLLAEKLRKLYEERAQKSPDLVERMSMYAGLPDAAFAGELHSVFGSEVADLPDWLEEHYAEWFTHRSAITETYRAYRGVFQGLKNDAANIRERMKTLRADVETRMATYDEDVKAYDKDSAALDRRVAKREFADSPKLKKQLERGLEQRRTELKETLDRLQDDIDRYNEMHAQLELLGDLSTELEEHLDSALAPITTRPTE